MRRGVCRGERDGMEVQQVGLDGEGWAPKVGRTPTLVTAWKVSSNPTASVVT